MLKVTNLSNEDLREIGLAFANYSYQADDQGMFPFEDPALTERYIVAFARFCVKLGVLYTISEKHEGYIALTTPSTKIPFKHMLSFFRELIGVLGWKRCFFFASWIKQSGESLEDKIRKQKKKCAVIQLLAVPEQYQHQGHMCALIEFARQIAGQQCVPLVVETDEKIKCDKYCHLGAEFVEKRRLGEHHYIYSMIYQAR